MVSKEAIPCGAAEVDLYRRVVETTSEGVWVLDAESRSVLVNASMCAMLGYSAEEMLGRSMFDFMDDERRAVAARNVERRRAGIAETHEFVFLSKKQEPVWTRLTTNPIQGADGSYQGALALVTDIGAERSRADERDRLWRILDESDSEIYIVRHDDWRIEYANAGALKNLGYSLEQLRGMTPVDITAAYTRETLLPLLAPLVEGTVEKLVFPSIHLRADGTTYPVEVRLQLAPYKHSRAYVAFINDVTERREAEAALQRSEARFRALIDRNLDLIMLLNARMEILFASPSVEAILGYTPEELRSILPLDLVHPEDIPLASDRFQRLLSGTEHVDTMVYRARHRDGSYRTLDANARNLLNDPAVAAVVVNARDVTDKMRLEEQLRQSQKLESIGRLAGGIAHDFNNILTTILGCTAFIQEDVARGRAPLEDIEEIKRAAERASELTGQLLAFARKGVTSPRSIALNQLMTHWERFLRRVLGEHIELSMRIEPELWPIDMDPTQMEQVILNLAVNGRDAMGHGGTLSIQAANVLLDDSFGAALGEITAGPHVVLTVKDTGLGVSPDILPHIFEPFFTTKRAGEGTGLGLATVYGIVRQSGGHISVESEVGVGTTFKLYFRRSLDEPEPLSAPGGRASPSRGRERILVVEDDDLVRRLVVRTLEGAGYTVQAGTRADEGFELARSSAFDLLVTDIVMPGGDGRQLATRLTALFPDLRVLYMSGYTDGAIAHGGVLDAGIEFLPKPFAPADLLARVRKLLDGRRPARAR